MKTLKATIIMLLLTMNVFAGSFVVNYLVLDGDKKAIEAFLDSSGKQTIGIYRETSPRMYLICDKKADEQDTNYGYLYGKSISLEIDSLILYTLIHDSDVLVLALFEKGELVFEYNSWPG